MIEVVKSVVGFFVGLVTVAQMLTGVFVCKVIQEKKSTHKISPTPFIAGLIISLLVLQQSRLIQNTTMTVVNIFGTILSCAYLAFYYHWAKGKCREQLVRDLKMSLTIASLLIIYSLIEKHGNFENQYGTIVALVFLAFVATPFRLIPQVIRKKSAEDLPYPMILTGLIVSIHWIFYSILIWNKLLLVQNIIAAIFCLIQISFYAIYPNKSSRPLPPSSTRSAALPPLPSPSSSPSPPQQPSPPLPPALSSSQSAQLAVISP